MILLRTYWRSDEDIDDDDFIMILNNGETYTYSYEEIEELYLTSKELVDNIEPLLFNNGFGYFLGEN